MADRDECRADADEQGAVRLDRREHETRAEDAKQEPNASMPDAAGRGGTRNGASGASLSAFPPWESFSVVRARLHQSALVAGSMRSAFGVSAPA